MKLTMFFGVLLLAGLASAAPASNSTTSDDVPATIDTTSNDTVLIDNDFFPDTLARYTAEHEIVNILLPLNQLNFEDDDDDGDSSGYLFVVEADTDKNGKRVDKGIYVIKDNETIKLLDNGRDAAAANEETKMVYFGASDGLYVFNAEKTKAEKYGSVTDSIISIAKVNGSDLIYILTEDRVLYKVTEEGTKKTKVDQVVNAQQIVLDYVNNLYYYTGDKQVYVLTPEAVTKIEGLPAATYLNILKPPFILENGVPVIVDNKAYVVYANGTVEKTDFEFLVMPTAFSMEGTLIQYFAHNKKIYEYNLMEIILGEILSDLREYLNDNTAEIQAIATRSRSEFVPSSASEATTEKGQ